MRSLALSALAPILVAVVLAQWHLGFIITVAVAALLPWTIYAVWKSIRAPASSRSVLPKVAMWWLALIVAFGAQAIRYVKASHEATRYSNLIESYIATHGTCPPNLEAIGSSDGELRARFGPAGYICQGGKPDFFYGSTFAPFEVERYDFQSRKWIHVND